jgi:hypothetical protein
MTSPPSRPKDDLHDDIDRIENAAATITGKTAEFGQYIGSMTSRIYYLVRAHYCDDKIYKCINDVTKKLAEEGLKLSNALEDGSSALGTARKRIRVEAEPLINPELTLNYKDLVHDITEAMKCRIEQGSLADDVQAIKKDVSALHSRLDTVKGAVDCGMSSMRIRLDGLKDDASAILTHIRDDEAE